jgi:hypothetical protein
MTTDIVDQAETCLPLGTAMHVVQKQTGIMSNIDDALAALEVGTVDALRSAEGLVKVLKRLRTAAKLGQVADIENLSAACRERGAEASSAAAGLSTAWQFDARTYLAEGYLAELLASAEEAGVKLVLGNSSQSLCTVGRRAR